MVSVVIGGRSANGRRRGAAGTGQRGGRGGRLQGAAVEGARLEGTAGGPVALSQRGGRRLEETNPHSDHGPRQQGRMHAKHLDQSNFLEETLARCIDSETQAAFRVYHR